MAVISHDLSITQIDKDVCVIKDPGEFTERTILRFRPHDMLALDDSLAELPKDLLTEREKQRIYFWAGYFYAFKAWGEKVTP